MCIPHRNQGPNPAFCFSPCAIYGATDAVLHKVSFEAFMISSPFDYEGKKYETSILNIFYSFSLTQSNWNDSDLKFLQGHCTQTAVWIAHACDKDLQRRCKRSYFLSLVVVDEKVIAVCEKKVSSLNREWRCWNRLSPFRFEFIATFCSMYYF